MTGSCSVLTRRWHHGCHPSLSLTACSVSHSATTHQDPALGWSGTPHPQHPWVGVSLHPIRPGCVRCHRWVTIGDPWWLWGHTGTVPSTSQPSQDRSPLRRGQRVTLGCHPGSSFSQPPKTIGGKAGASPHPDVPPCSIWMLCPGRIQPNPSLIKNIYISVFQSFRQENFQLSSPSFPCSGHRTQLSTHLNSPPELSPALCSSFPKFAASFPRHFHESRRFVSWDSALPPLPVPAFVLQEHGTKGKEMEKTGQRLQTGWFGPQIAHKARDAQSDG